MAALVTARERLDELGWTQKEPRSAYDRAVFLALEAAIRELEETRERLRRVEEGLRAMDAMRLEAALAEDGR